MCQPLPEPDAVHEDPELAVLLAAAGCLRLAQLALLAAFPDLECDFEQRSDRSAQAAYASAIFSQSRSLVFIIEEYVESLELRRALGNRQQSSDHTQPF